MEMYEVIKNLFQGNIEDAIEASASRSVDWIVYLGSDLPEKLGFSSSIPVIHVPLRDNEQDERKFEIVSKIMSLIKSQKILVACRQGISRSPMIVVYYLLYSGYVFEGKNKYEDFRKACRVVENKVAEFRPEPSMFKMIEEKFIES